MCCATKPRIAEALRELLRERPLQKITVQDIMNRTGMKRQSFYYHFQDVNQVLEWEVDRQLFQRMAFCWEQSYDEWCLSVLEELNSNAWFYRHAFSALNPDGLLRRYSEAIRPQICRLVAGEPFPEEGSLTEEEECAVDFFGRALCSELMGQVLDGNEGNRTRSQRCIHLLGRMIPQGMQVLTGTE